MTDSGTHPLEREPLPNGATLAIVCTRCERDVIYVRVECSHIELLSKWLGCDCQPERERLGLLSLDEVVRKRIDLERELVAERWGAVAA